MHRLAGLTTVLVALAVPGAASAAESVSVSLGKLDYSNSVGAVDHLTVADGGTAYSGQYLVSDTSTPTALAGAGCTTLSLGHAACAGPISMIKADLTGGADRITVDVTVAATVSGGSEDDVIVGGGRGDWIFGNTGNDTIHGRGGGDSLSGGDGDDVIEARDGGTSDVIACGAGVDTAYIDVGEGTSGCETVIDDQTVASSIYTPPSSTTTEEPVVEDELTVDDQTGTPLTADTVEDGAVADEGDVGDAFDPSVVPTLAGPLRLASADIAVDAKGVASFDLSCAATETGGCRGKVFLDPVLSRKGKGKGKSKERRGEVRAVASRRGRYGRSRFVVAAGKRHKLEVRLSNAARKALGLSSGRKARAARRGRVLRTRVTVVQKGRRPQRAVVRLRRR